jgi:hypothetical protein
MTDKWVEITFEIANFEYRSARFCCCTLEFRAVDLREPICAQELAEEVADGSLELEHCLVCLCLAGFLSA